MAGYFKKVLVPRTVQPEPGVGVNQKWIDRGLVALFDCRQAMELISGDRATNDTTTFGPSGDGVAADFSSTANQQYAHRDAYAITSAITIVALCDVDALTKYSAIISKMGTTTTNVPYELRVGAAATDSFINFARANTAVRDRRGASNRLTAPFSGLIAVTAPSGLIESAATLYVNNVPTVLSSNASGTGLGTDNGSAVWIGRRYDGATQLDGRIYYVALFSRDLSDDENNELYLNRFDLYEPEETNVWVPTSAGGSPTVVTLDPAAFNLTPQGTQNTLGTTLTASALNFTAQDVQNNVINNLTAAAFDFVAHDIAAENASTATVTLDTATFDFVANDNQNALYAELSAATCDFIANDAQPLTAHSLDVCAFDFVGQDTQNTLGLLLENAIFDFVTRPITAGDPLAPTTGRATNMMLMGVGN